MNSLPVASRVTLIALISVAAVVGGPYASAAPQIVLGSETGPGVVGYGTERPTTISLGSCPNAIHDITWNDWGGPTAHGSGTACTQYGTPPHYDLVASDIGVCHGQTAYRTLQISTNNPQSICE